MVVLLMSLLIGFSANAQSCPDGFEHEDIKEIWVCKSLDDGVQYREKQTWHTESETLIEIDFFKNSKKPYRRDVYESKYGLLGKYFFKYLTESESDFKFREIKIFDFNNNLLATHSTEVSSDTIEDSRNNISESSPKALIIDSGFNYVHKDLIGKHYVNPHEIIDGIDNDNDGLVDNLTTFNGEQGAGGSIDYKFNINQFIQLPTKGAAFTHGGFVASVAMNDINELSYLGVGGDIHSAVYLYKILEQINKHDIRFTNMSFGFGDKGGLALVDRESIEAVEGIMRASFKALHVVAAGNGSRNFDEVSYSEYPACINLRNKITVGALDTSEIDESSFNEYQVAHFSNIGFRCVDILAPGVDMVGAGLGDTFMKASGTSVSSPYVLNLLLKMYELNDELKTQDYKEILLKTAFIPIDKPFAVKSGGVVFPSRALNAVEQISNGLSLDEAVWMARNDLNAVGELIEKNKIIELWKARKL